MKYILLAVHKDYIPDEVITGYRIFDKEKNLAFDADENTVMGELISGTEIDGLHVVDGVIKGNNGNLDRYTTIINGSSYGNCPIVISKEFPEQIYEVINYLGIKSKMKLSNIIAYANSEGLANAKIVTRENTRFISRINGEIEKDKIFNDMSAGSNTRKKMMLLNVTTYKLDDDNMAYSEDKEAEIDELVIGRGCLGIKPNGFSNTQIKSLVLPNTCIDLGFRCFSNMKNLERIKLPEGIKVIPNFAFDGCIALEEIDLPNSCVEIKANAFRGCNKLRLIRTGPRKPNVAYGAIPPRVRMIPRR